MNEPDPVRHFFAAYPPAVAELAARLRVAIRAALPDAAETVDVPGRVVGYSFGPGYNALVCTIIPSQSGLKFGVVGGAELSDPNGLLEGTGKKHRYVQFKTTHDLARRGLSDLIKAAGTLTRVRMGMDGP